MTRTQATKSVYMKNISPKENPLPLNQPEVAVLEEEVDQPHLVEEQERQTTLHCKIKLETGVAIRIWKTTYLIEKESGIKRNLIHNLNIPIAPNWKMAEKTGWYHFTLFFEALSKDCNVFDFVEQINQTGGFEYLNITRNNTDVYNITLT